ncbi:T-box [Dictyocaulus viviparus]|uniref:T-box n=1 Tax=Dictyocaulus viviparus TaxID=29172 RepID=A0A0D8XE67_DICVI|nr:T-box [Dictyocaulus viviparus]
MEVSVRLANEELWTKFHNNTTEMVVTKTGRKMFPKLEYTIEGLKTNLAYGLVLQIEQVDDNRYKFSGGEWSPAGRAESGGVPKNVMHHDGVMPGAHWMRQTVNFERVKITNNLNDVNPSHVGYNLSRNGGTVQYPVLSCRIVGVFFHFLFEYEIVLSTYTMVLFIDPWNFVDLS